MKGFVVKLMEQEERRLYGLGQPSGDRRQRRDIPALSERFFRSVGAAPGTLLPFYVLSKDYDAGSGSFALFVGGTRPHPGLEEELLPAGIYARIEVQPRLGVLWGLSIGAAKRWFYTRWLPENCFEAVNLEYELHTTKSTGRRPSVDLLFALQLKPHE